MDSKDRNHCIMAKLGKVEKLLKKFETMPECNGCTTELRRGRYVLRSAMKDIVQKKESRVNWNLVDQIIRVVLRVSDLINQGILNGFFNSCKINVGYIWILSQSLVNVSRWSELLRELNRRILLLN